MKINLIVFNIFLIIIAFIGSFNTTHAQTEDKWSGEYMLKSNESIPLDTIRIEKTADLKKDEVPSKYESDLQRWTIASKKDAYADQLIARRFLFNTESEEDEYKQFGWTDLYLKGKMECLDLGHMFICQTERKETISIDEESFVSETGFFGVRLHYGLFLLERLK
ncbi:hypothetical protein [Fulvivirga sediminis]|uniref:Phosphate ABC transporter permease n=1 Tax=Fulvivirga sediminis TaxID=2803949 RepID=A0A937K1D5_9BACT|nr:hypothetical protein [Fulvivirga sediminis]MBL3657356.1 hypothetical protein [Fulvivirga sediminis]